MNLKSCKRSFFTLTSAVILITSLALSGCVYYLPEETGNTGAINTGADEKEKANSSAEDTGAEDIAAEDPGASNKNAGDIDGDTGESEMSGNNADDAAGHGSVEFAKKLKLGWNLGNTLDAFDDNKVFADDLKTENCWGNPTTTKEMIDYLRDQGFTTVRIPVTWHPHLEDPDINSGSGIRINEAWLKRVKEVVDYCIEDDLYVIINIHHDNSKEYYYPDTEHREQSLRYVEAVWKTVAECFKDYDEHLIFESLNEPRLVGTIYEWKMNYFADECLDAEKIINESNQLFVDTVRASGGKNAERYLLIPGYDASSIPIQSKNFLIPRDTTEGKLMIEVHAYVPYSFALQELSSAETNRYFDPEKSSSTYQIDDLGKTLDEKFLSKGVGVVVDEFGARNKKDNDKDRSAYYKYFIETMGSYGIPCCIWDNGIASSDNEQFGIVNRRELSWYFPGVAESIMSAGREGYGN